MACFFEFQLLKDENKSLKSRIILLESEFESFRLFQNEGIINFNH